MASGKLHLLLVLGATCLFTEPAAAADYSNKLVCSTCGDHKTALENVLTGCNTFLLYCGLPPEEAVCYAVLAVHLLASTLVQLFPSALAVLTAVVVDLAALIVALGKDLVLGSYMLACKLKWVTHFSLISYVLP
ncbi:uncharacterized protein LOC126452547 [Schistocerca serialis cubense]|uniref:uncharacterized protein LOC126417113 n=1 Tax=Schistocerca serialis cubense TaxID=2023355 RepID=UPI00214F0742|nr:uncharacterized protein LOC126417113 [Schistocerca serialis cubense]XP_049947070.1 uncharacterized protein LOC126452547 [Schistocerca serialis cubense]